MKINETTRSQLLELCQKIASLYPNVVFWKHLDRGLIGSGDIDIFADSSSLDLVSNSIQEFAFKKLDGIKGYICCGHLSYARLNFIVLSDLYPKLLEIDVGSISTRLGIELFGIHQLLKYSIINDDKLRVLRDGAQAVVLIILYLISPSGNLKLKPDDHLTILHGLRSDRNTAQRFWQDLNVQIDQKFFDQLCDSLLSGKNQKFLVRKIWWLLFIVSLKINLILIFRSKFDGLFIAVKNKYQPLCSARDLIINRKRVAREENSDEFFFAMRDKRHNVMTKIARDHK